MPEPLTDTNKLERVVQIIAPDSTLLRTWSLHGGISADVTAFEIKNPGGQVSRLILRRPSEKTLQRNPQSAEAEFKVLQLTKSLGLATQTPYYLDQSGTIFSTPYLVIEYVEGNPEFPPAPAADFTFQLAKHLAQIHSTDCSRRDISFLPKAATECVEVSRKQFLNVQPALEVQRIFDLL